MTAIEAVGGLSRNFIGGFVSLMWFGFGIIPAERHESGRHSSFRDAQPGIVGGRHQDGARKGFIEARDAPSSRVYSI